MIASLIIKCCLKHVPGLGVGHQLELVIRDKAVKMVPQRILIPLMSNISWNDGSRIL